MFTGIIESTAEVIEQHNEKLVLSRPSIFNTLRKGQSIAVNGACLSVVDYDEATIVFDVVPETYEKTNLQTAQVANVERAMPANGRFEGHIVLGHVDGVARLIKRKKEETGERLFFEIPLNLNTFFVQKGSVAINGVSLTIAKYHNDICEIALIPHTLRNTNLGMLQENDMVNIEADYLAKIILNSRR